MMVNLVQRTTGRRHVLARGITPRAGADRERIMKFDYMTIWAICLGAVAVFFLVGGFLTYGSEWIALGAGFLVIAYIVLRPKMKRVSPPSQGASDATPKPLGESGS